MRKHKLWMRDIAFDQNNIFFSAMQFNGLFKASIYGGEAIYMGSFPNESDSKVGLHGDVVQYKDEILFLPNLADYLALYNIKQDSFASIKFPVQEDTEVTSYLPKIASGILVGSCAYAFGCRYPCIVRYDFETGCLKYYDESECFKKFDPKENKSFFGIDLCLIENSIFARTCQADAIVEFDVVEEKLFFHPLKKKMSIILCGDQEKLWLFEENGMGIYTWNKWNGLSEVMQFQGYSRKNKQELVCSVQLKDEIWIFSLLSEFVLKWNKVNKKLEEESFFCIENSQIYQNDSFASILFRKKHNDKIYLMSVLENKLYCFSENGDENYCVDIYTDRTEIVRKLFTEQTFLNEQEDTLWSIAYGLEDFLNVVTVENKSEEYDNRQIKAGTKIYKHLKSLFKEN